MKRCAPHGLGLGVDVLVVPSLLLLIARDLFVRDSPRVLAWRLLHDPRLASWAHLVWLQPRPAPETDRDPIALVLSTGATVLAGLYLAGALAGWGSRFRAAVVGAATLVLVVLPTLGFITMGHLSGRPYGQDGGVVQIPLALDKILAGQSPYAADYSDSILGKEAEKSPFWSQRGGNPILRHHAYLPGTHLLMMPFHWVAKRMGMTFDPRLLTLVAYLAAALFAARLAVGASAQLSAAAVVLLNPLVYWHQIFGANDILFVAMVLASVLLLRQRPLAGAALVGLACATKQLAWPFAPFLLLVAAGRSAEGRSVSLRDGLGRLVRLALVAALVFAGVVLPVAALGFRTFYADIVGYNVGLPGADNYPLGGTPGFGFANFLIYFGAVRSLGDYFPFGIFYGLLVPLGLLWSLAVWRRGEFAFALAVGTAALLTSVYFSRVVHPNYLVPVAILLPVAALAGAAPRLSQEARRPLESLGPDTVLVPLLLLSIAVETVEQGSLHLLWDDAVATRFPQYASGLVRWLLPRCGPELSKDPWSLALGAVAAGLAVAYLAVALLGVGARVRSAVTGLAVVAVVAVPLFGVVKIGERTGIARTQDEWTVEVQAAARSMMSPPGAESSPWAREAVSTSFRGEPARLLSAERWPVPAGAVLLQQVAAAGGSRDPRWISGLAAVLMSVLVLRLAGPSVRSWLLAGLVLVPAAMTTVVFGGGAIIGLAGLAARPRAPKLRGTGRAVAAASSPGALLATPFLAVGAGPGGRVSAGRAVIAGLTLGLAPLVASRCLGTAIPILPAFGPGLGLVNLWLYFGCTPGIVVILIGGAALIVAWGLLLNSAARGDVPPALAAATAVVLGLIASPSTPPDLVLLPVGLLALTAATSAWGPVPSGTAGAEVIRGR